MDLLIKIFWFWTLHFSMWQEAYLLRKFDILNLNFGLSFFVIYLNGMYKTHCKNQDISQEVFLPTLRSISFKVRMNTTDYSLDSIEIYLICICKNYAWHDWCVSIIIKCLVEWKLHLAISQTLFNYGLMYINYS